MKRLAILAVIAVVLSTGPAAAAEIQRRFEISAETGLASVLSGPEIKENKNLELRFGFYPTKEFELTLTYIQWNGQLGRTDPLQQDFGRDFNRTINPPVEGGPNDCAPRPKCYLVDFADASLANNKNDRKVELRQIEVGAVKTIPLGIKHWEAFVGVATGVQRSHAEFKWTGYVPPVNNPTLVPSWERTDSNEFIIAVRGGVRYMPLDWVGAQVNFRWIPIAKVFGRDYNAVELNGGVIFRFGKV